MRTFKLALYPGQRFRIAEAGTPGLDVVVTQIFDPVSITDARHIEFRELLSARLFKWTWLEVARACVAGTMSFADDSTFSLPVAKLDKFRGCISQCSPAQQARVAKMVAYVLAIALECPDHSVKSPVFHLTVKKTFRRRFEAAAAQIQAAAKSTGPTQPVILVESEAPSPATVYRWYLRYRKSGNDAAALAAPMLVSSHRTRRKPDTRRLLEAFLTAKLSRVEKTSIKELSRQFNEILPRISPLAIEETIEQWNKETVEHARRNAFIKTKRGVNRSPKRKNKNVEETDAYV